MLDENILASQRELLRSWRISTRQIGFEVQPQGLQDDQIISLPHEHRRTTLFTRDLGFYDRNLCHRRYCLVWRGVDAATYVDELRSEWDQRRWPSWTTRFREFND